MVWRVEFARSAEQDLKRLDRQSAHRILTFLRDRVAARDDPRMLAKPLKGGRAGETYWRFRVGDYRVVALIEDEGVRVVVVRIGRRREVYRR